MTSQTYDHPLAIHVIWHPGSSEAGALADAVFGIFRNNVTQIEGGLGIPVLFYSEPADNSTAAPPEVALGTAKRHFVLPVIEEELIDAVEGGGDWRAWFDTAVALRAQHADEVTLLPIALSDEAIAFCNHRGLPNAVRWHYWAKQGQQERIDRLAVHLIPAVFNALRAAAGVPAGEHGEKKVELFLSHAKADGRDLAIAFRGHIQMIPGLGDFFDEVDIQPGEDFATVLEKRVGSAAVLAIHTDAYASRDWCCWEVVASKRFNVPIVAAHCIRDREQRAFPYLGNLPSVRVDEATPVRALEVIRRLLEEVLRELLWRSLVRQLRARHPDVLAEAVDTWRAPEVVWLMLGKEIAEKGSAEILILHPDPPLGRNESAILAMFKPKISLLTPIGLMAR